MALPHPKSRKDKHREEEKSNFVGVVWNLVKRTIDIANYRNTQDDVKPAKDRTLLHDVVPFIMGLSPTFLFGVHRGRRGD
jgi:hypothetical protein